MRGSVKRRNFFRVWLKRFAVLDKQKLTIFKDETETKVDMVIDITEDSIVEPNDSDGLFRFTVTQQKNTVFLETDSQENLLKWVMAIRGCLYPSTGISMDDFEIISVIGRGFYGKVMLVKRKQTGEMLAIKSIQKSKLLQRKKVTTVLIERSILEKVRNPFIVRMICAFQTPSKFYLGMEYVPGGELFFHMSKRGRFSIPEVRLYLAEIAIALAHLHSCGIVYRDLKPENILLDSEGHLKLTDFGLSKDLSKTGATTTFCGTTEYFAPEIVRHEPYGIEVDWWSLGVLAYELLFGTTPFHAQNRARLFKNILEEAPSFPQSTPADVQEMIMQLLSKDPRKRPKLPEIRNMKFFSELNFEDVVAKRVCPLFVPAIGAKVDLSNFDRDFTQEPALDSFVMPVYGSPQKYPGFSFEATDREIIEPGSEDSFHSLGAHQGPIDAIPRPEELVEESAAEPIMPIQIPELGDIPAFPANSPYFTSEPIVLHESPIVSEQPAGQPFADDPSPTDSSL